MPQLHNICFIGQFGFPDSKFISRLTTKTSATGFKTRTKGVGYELRHQNADSNSHQDFVSSVLHVCFLGLGYH